MSFVRPLLRPVVQPVVRFFFREQERRLLATARRLVRRDGTLVVGPWLGEVGFELLYWVPFLRWLFTTEGVDPRRVVALSRGGTQKWYGALATGYVEVFDLIDPTEYRERNKLRWRERRQQKQTSIDAFDRFVFEQALVRLGLQSASLLHPSLMFGLFQQFWQGLTGIAAVSTHTTFAGLDDCGSLPEGLPETYVAARFYHRPSFPEADMNRDWARAAVRALAATVPVVVLDSGLEVDDHPDVVIPEGLGVWSLRGHSTPQANLAVQTAVVAHASAFVGTYGGLSYLGPFTGVPAFGVYSDRSRFSERHLDTLRGAMGVLEGGALGLADCQRVPPDVFARLVIGGLRGSEGAQRLGIFQLTEN